MILAYIAALATLASAILLFKMVQPKIAHAVVVTLQDKNGLIVYQTTHIFTTLDEALKARDKLLAKLGTAEPATIFVSQNVTLDQGPL